MPKNKVIFITATDTGVGKTVTSLVLGVLLKSRGIEAGVIKPVQCAGIDAQFLKKSLKLSDDLKLINPYFAPEPLSPHLAFRRAGIKFDRRKIRQSLKVLQSAHGLILVEGAGGLMVPIARGFDNGDLASDIKATIIIVARLGLGTINHTLLTIREARRRNLKILGIIFCQTKPGVGSLPEKTNPREIKNLSGEKVLGTIPYLKSLKHENILRRCRDLKIDTLI